MSKVISKKQNSLFKMGIVPNKASLEDTNTSLNLG